MGRLTGAIEIKLRGGSIIACYRGKTFALDPKAPVNSNYYFISHAHVDHVCGKLKENILSSKETIFLARERGYHLPDPIMLEDVELYDSGHIVGSKSILIEDKIFYTGDISIRARGFLKTPKLPKAKILIIETTYGHPSYSFPNPATIVSKVNKLISEMYERGVPIVLCGYPLGKAQLLTYLFSTWEPIYSQENILRLNEACRTIGVPLKKLKSYHEAKREGLLEKRPWILLAPSYSLKSSLIKFLKKRYEAVTFYFSGWALYNKNGYNGADYSFPLSDHCDYSDLIKVVKYVDPEKIYTVHGFAREFAIELRKMGYDAEALYSSQPLLEEFYKND
ncbi:MAG: MBL fold metallo-hydrolase RNA specificity domain-containing protein [Nitrososphaeria archaeon]